ncbi:MAG: hypothetical protein IT460_07495 [Planctomycetes bacterium]|nr:hypothetical protein [Planctomycetota bacterium]
MTPSLARFAGFAAATVAAVCGLGAWPTLAAAGSGSLVAVGAAALLAFLGAVLGYLPLTTRAAGASVEARAQAWMIGLGVRLFVTMAVLLALWGTSIPHRTVFLVWTGVLYVALLAFELVVVARSLAAAGRPGTSA